MTHAEKNHNSTHVPDIASEPFEKYANSLYAYAKKRVQSEEDILDLLQDTFVDYIEGQDKFRESSSPLTYLTAILRNKIFHLYRKQNREISFANEDLNVVMITSASHSASAAERFVDAEDTQRIVEACVRRLKPPYFEAFVMREIEELSTDEICKILSVSVTNLNVILHRARQKLQQMLKDEGIENAH